VPETKTDCGRLTVGHNTTFNFTLSRESVIETVQWRL
jgi:hypothetical protein